MTIEEATKYLQKVYANTKNSSYASALAFAISALRAQQEAEKNEPLMLEELREMHGEPVWRVQSGHNGRWVLVDVFWKSKGVVYLTNTHRRSEQADIAMNEGVKLYRRPPTEEGECHGTH